VLLLVKGKTKQIVGNLNGWNDEMRVGFSMQGRKEF
jgi:hypothetical protein